MITNRESGTSVDEIADGIYRISTPVPPELLPGGFTFNQYLIADDQPLVYHTGPNKMFPFVREAIESVLPVSSLRYIGFSHYEADECGSLNEFLEAAPGAEPLCSQIAKLVSVDDIAIWECGHLFETTTGTLFCGDLFTQGGSEHEALTSEDILKPSEEMRSGMDYFSQTRFAGDLAEKLAQTSPRILACMHGSAWKGDGATLLRQLGQALAR
jgi:flavorubredoxin